MLLNLYLDHLVFRVRNVADTQLFWDALLGEPASKSVESLMDGIRTGCFTGDKQALPVVAQLNPHFNQCQR